MAYKRLTDLTEKTAATENALLHIVEPADTSQSPQGSSFKIKLLNLLKLPFTKLTDAPASYTGQAGKPVVVNDAENGVVFGTPQNNVGRRIVLTPPSGGAEVNIPYVVSKINTNATPYVITETQTPVIFTVAKGVSGGFQLYIFLFLRGKGTWGGVGNTAGQVNTTNFFGFPPAPVTADEATQEIPFTLAPGQTISEWLNIQNPNITIQPQQAGYVVFKSGSVQYLWLADGGVYGLGGLQSTDTDFQLLEDDAAAPGTPTINEVLTAGNVGTDKVLHLVETASGVEVARHTATTSGHEYRSDGFTQSESFETPLADVGGKRVAHRQTYKKLDVIQVENAGEIVFPATNAFYEVAADTYAYVGEPARKQFYYAEGGEATLGDMFLIITEKAIDVHNG